MDNEPTIRATFLHDVFDKKEQRSKRKINRQAGIPIDENLASAYELDNKPARWALANLSSSIIDFRLFVQIFGIQIFLTEEEKLCIQYFSPLLIRFWARKYYFRARETMNVSF